MNLLLRNPLSEYARYLGNWIANRRRQPKLSQHYMALAFESTFEADVTLFEHSRLLESRIGAHSYIGASTMMAHTSVGRFCSIGSGCRFGMGRHPTEFVSTHPIFYSTERHTGTTFADRPYFNEHAPVRVGHDVWIGANAILLDGVDIGHGAIVAAGAVVAHDVAPYAIVGGVPAEVIRFRFDTATIEALLASRWWDRDVAWLHAHAALFRDPSAFIAALAPIARGESA